MLALLYEYLLLLCGCTWYYPSGRQYKDLFGINMKTKMALYFRPEWYITRPIRYQYIQSLLQGININTGTAELLYVALYNP